MDLRGLLARYEADRPLASVDLARLDPTLSDLSLALSGVTLNGGLVRFYDQPTATARTAEMDEYFPAFAGRATCFAVDWLGRQFALGSGVEDLVLLFEPGTAGVLEIPVGLAGFLELELIEQAEAALAADFYAEWRDESGDTRPLAINECVGYRVPLFLGGADVTQNLERGDMSVYLSLCAQLARGVGR